MRTFRSKTSLRLAKDIGAFFEVAFGIGRGVAPDGGPAGTAGAGPGARPPGKKGKGRGPKGGGPAKLRQRLARQEERLKRQKEHVDRNKKRVELLQGQLERMRAESAGGFDLGATAPAEGDGERPGIGLRPGDPHYRSWVGRPENYDLKAGMQVSLLLAAGLRETHKLVEVGCGSLRAGRMFIPYLLPGNYYGIEPNRWVVEEGIKHELGESILQVKRPNFRFVDDFSADGFGVEFDFALAQSVFSHTYPDMTLAGLKGISAAMAPTGKIVANFVERGETTEDGSGWLYPGCTTHTWERILGMLDECGLVARKIRWLPSMQWFVATSRENEDDIEDLANRLRSPLADAQRARRIGMETLPGETGD